MAPNKLVDIRENQSPTQHLLEKINAVMSEAELNSKSADPGST